MNRWKKSTEPNPFVVKIIWYALMSSVGAHYYVGTIVQKNLEPNPQMKFIFAGMAVMPALISFFFRQKALKVAQDRQLPSLQIAQQVTIFSVISWALCESISVMGLLTRIMTGDEMMANGLYATALALMVFYWPIDFSNNSPQASYKSDYKQ